MRQSAFLLMLLLVTTGTCVLGQGQQSAAAHAVVNAYNPFDEPRPKIPQEITADKRLDMKVKVFVKSENMKQLFADLSAKTGVKITASRELWGERPIICFHSRSLRDVMTEISGLYGYHWLISGKPGAYEYEIFEDVRHAQRRARGGESPEIEMLIDVVHGCADGKMDGKLEEIGRSKDAATAEMMAAPYSKTLVRALNEFGDDVLRSAFDKGGVTTPFGILPESAQKGLIDSLNQSMESYREKASSFGVQPRDTALYTYLDFGNSNVVLSGTLGQVGLSAQIKTEKRGTVVLQWPAMRLTEDQLRELTGRSASEKLTGDVPLPSEPKVTVTKLRWVTFHKALLLADVLDAIARQSDRDVIADYYFQTDEMQAVSGRPMDQLVNDVFGRFHYKCEVNGKTMRFRYDKWWSEPLMVEPSKESLDHWWGRICGTGALSLADVLLLGRLSDVQLRWQGFRWLPWFDRARALPSTVRIWSSLTTAQDAQARTTDGLPVAELTDGQSAELAKWAVAMKVDSSPESMARSVIKLAETGLSVIRSGNASDPFGQAIVETGRTMGSYTFTLRLPDGKMPRTMFSIPPPLEEKDRLELAAQRKADAEADVIEVLK